MSALGWLALVYAVLAAKLVLGPRMPESDFMPDPILVLAILSLVTIEHPLAFAIAGAVGLIGDLLWGERLGTSLLCLLLVGYWLGGVRRWFELERPGRAIGAAWLLAAVVLLARGLLTHALEGQAIADPEAMVLRAAWEGLWCAVAVYLSHLAIQHARQRVGVIFQGAG